MTRTAWGAGLEISRVVQSNLIPADSFQFPQCLLPYYLSKVSLVSKERHLKDTTTFRSLQMKNVNAFVSS